MSSMCSCCSPLKPRYKRLIDNIFPQNPDDGLVKNSMDTLTYYASTSPEKLDRIGEYLAYKIGRDIYRNRKGFVRIGMEAMDTLLKSCHAQTLNLYVESFLKTVQKMLESPEYDLQILASQSFSEFSKIEEETVCYHRSYDFFVDRFSSFCHSDVTDPELRTSLRSSGLQGLSGVIRKTVNEDLAENIWEPKHMDKIIPSLLFNIQSDKNFGYRMGRDTPDLGANEDNIVPSKLADQLLRELVQASSFTTVKSILTPVLRHIDNHDLWNDPFAVHVFEAIMYSIQGDLSYVVIEKVMSHLDKVSDPSRKGSIATVLSKIIGIGVGDSTVGPSVLEIINALLKHLKKSVEQSKHQPHMMHEYHQALLAALGEYTRKLPDYQKIEVMNFCLAKVNQDSSSTFSDSHNKLQQMMLRSLLAVAEKYMTSMFFSNFPQSFLHTLMSHLQSGDPDVRLLVLQVLQTLVDRHENLEKLFKPTVYPASLGISNLPIKSSRSDQIFSQRTLYLIYDKFKKVLEMESNSIEFLEAMYTTVSILAVETSASDDSTFYLIDLIDSIQNIAVTSLSLSTEQRFALHSIAISLLAIAALVVNIPELDSYVNSVIEIRQSNGNHMLPPLQEEYSPGIDPNSTPEEMLIQQEPIKEALKNAGKNIQDMDSLPRKRSPRNSWQEQLNVAAGSNASSRRPSTISVSSVGLDFDSASSSPGIVRKPISEDVTVSAFKKILEGPSAKEKDDEEKRKKELLEKYKTATFEELEELTIDKKRESLSDTLRDLFNRVIFSETQGGDRVDRAESEPRQVNGHVEPDAGDQEWSIMNDPAPYEKLFPEIFMY